MKSPWEDRIEARPEVLAGKPVIKGTRLAADILASEKVYPLAV